MYSSLVQGSVWLNQAGLWAIKPMFYVFWQHFFIKLYYIVQNQHWRKTAATWLFLLLWTYGEILNVEGGEDESSQVLQVLRFADNTSTKRKAT